MMRRQDSRAAAVSNRRSPTRRSGGPRGRYSPASTRGGRPATWYRSSRQPQFSLTRRTTSPPVDSFGGLGHHKDCLCRKCDPNGKKANALWKIDKTPKMTDFYPVKERIYSDVKMDKFRRARAREIAKKSPGKMRPRVPEPSEETHIDANPPGELPAPLRFPARGQRRAPPATYPTPSSDSSSAPSSSDTESEQSSTASAQNRFIDDKAEPSGESERSYTSESCNDSDSGFIVDEENECSVASTSTDDSEDEGLGHRHVNLKQRNRALALKRVAMHKNKRQRTESLLGDSLDAAAVTPDSKRFKLKSGASIIVGECAMAGGAASCLDDDDNWSSNRETEDVVLSEGPLKTPEDDNGDDLNELVDTDDER